MLRRVAVRSFKSLFDVEVELGRVNVFVGANGSGKSNFLEALGVLGAAAAGRVDDESLLRRGVRPGVPQLYKASFVGETMRNAIRFGAFSESADFEIELINPKDRELRASAKPIWYFKTEKLTSEGEKIVGRSPASRLPSLEPESGLAALEIVKLEPGAPAVELMKTLREYSIYAPNTPSLRGLIPDAQTREPVGLHGGRLAEAISDLRRAKKSDAEGLLEDVFDDLEELMDWVSDFGSKPSGGVPLSPSIPAPREVLYFQDRFMAKGRNRLSGYDASEGALYVLFAAVAAAHPRAPRLLAIDNVDAGLNPRLIRSLMERLCGWVTAQADKQILLTTHNPLVLDGLPLQDDRVRLFAVDRSNRGKTQIRRVEVDAELLHKADEGWPLSRLWVSAASTSSFGVS